MIYLFKTLFIGLIFLIGLNGSAYSEKTIIADMIVQGKDKYKKNLKIALQTPDENFKKILSWSASYKEKNFISFDKESGYPCFRFVRANTFDGKKIALIFKYSPGSSSQTNTCVSELYKISSTQSESILATAGFDSNGKINSDLYRYYQDGYWGYTDHKNAFVVLVSNSLRDLCIKQASQTGVVNVCYDFTKAQEALGKIVQQRVEAIKESS